MRSPYRPEDKKRYRFRQCLTTGKVLCLNAIWPPLPNKPSTRNKMTSSFQYKTAIFPIRPNLCPKCRGKGIVHSQQTRKLLGVCFWCDGKGRVDDADIANAQRRITTGLSLDHKTTF